MTTNTMSRDEAGKAIRKRAMEGCPLARELLILRGMCSCQGDEKSVDEAEDRYLELAALTQPEQLEQPEAGRDDAQAQEADWTDRELKLIQFAMYRFMNDAYSQANYAAQRGTADQVRAFHADAKDAEAILAKLRTLAPPVSAEAGRDEYHRCGKNIRRHKVSECRPQAQEAVAEVVEVGGSLGELRIIRWIKGPLPVGAKLFAVPPANAEAGRVRLDTACGDLYDRRG